MNILLSNIKYVNEGKSLKGNILIVNDIIKTISKENINVSKFKDLLIIDGKGKIAMPGVIDDQVHFREPGLTNKADIYTESKAAIAGGVTTFMDMPNVIPQTTTIELLDDKIENAKGKSLANFSFYFGATNTNIEEIKKIDKNKVCGIKVFMGSSTGNMLVNNIDTLEHIFKESPVLIATHCEDEETIIRNTKKYKELYKNDIPLKFHPIIRSEEACFLSSSLAVSLAKKHNSRLHILHLTTKKELDLFDNKTIAKDKQITAEVCVHHLWFDNNDYEKYGSKIKCNPAIKTAADKEALFNAVLENKIDVIATDHAPHLISEKSNKYLKSPSGIPLVQHSLLLMLEFYHKNKISLEQIVDKMCHKPAEIFKIHNRGYLKEGYYADITIININEKTKVLKDNILYKCKWSPFEDYNFSSKISHTIVNGNLIYQNGNFDENYKGKLISFDR